MELDEIKKLIELLKETDVTELQIEREGTKLKIRREKYLSSFEAFRTVKQPPASSEAVKALKEETVEEKQLVTITSPIVGIFHRAPSPESPPFVEVGSVIKKARCSA